MVEDDGYFRYQPCGLIFDSETLNSFAHNAIADSPVYVLRVRHDNEYLAKTALRAVDFAHGVPGMTGALKNQAMVSHTVGNNFVIEVIKRGGGFELEFAAIIQYQRVSAPGGIPVIFGVEIKQLGTMLAH